jgi:hypothetical protein
MNKTLRFYILTIVIASVSVCVCRGDILDGYITGFMEKADSTKVKSPASTEVPQVQSNQSSERSVDSQAVPKSKDAEDSQLNKSKKLRKQLKDSSIMVLSGRGGSDVNVQLKSVLEQLKSLRFSGEGETVEPEPEIEPDVEPVFTTSAVVEEQPVVEKIDDREKTKKSQSQENDLPEVVLPDDISGVVDSFQLAESLFRIDDKVNALKYYRKAFELCLPLNSMPNPKRGWVLFQIGNSLYGKDTMAAIKIYEQLILEHPSSDWTNCARTKLQVLKWQLTDKPAVYTMSETK